MKKVIIITGPTGTGKTTLCKIVSERHGFAYISGDEIKEELFSDIEDITQHPAELKKVKEELLERAKEIFDGGESVVIDYVILGEEYISKIKELFGDNLIFKVILPPIETIIKRDKERTNWTSGEDSVKGLYEEYRKLESVIGKENYIDDSGETPQETFNKYFK